jgi:hypothetical protein
MEARCEGEQARGLREQSFVYGLYVGMGGISWIGYCDGPTLTILDFFPFASFFFSRGDYISFRLNHLISSVKLIKGIILATPSREVEMLLDTDG